LLFHLSVLDLTFPIGFVCVSEKTILLKNKNLLFILKFGEPCFLFVDIHILSCFYVCEISISLIFELLQLNIIFEMHLIH